MLSCYLQSLTALHLSQTDAITLCKGAPSAAPINCMILNRQLTPQMVDADARAMCQGAL